MAAGGNTRDQHPDPNLRSLSPKDAAKVMGGKPKLQRMLNGEKFDTVINSTKDPLYRLERMGGAHNGSMRSEELSLMAKDLKVPSLSEIQRTARSYVVDSGVATGNEYGVAIVDGKIIDKFTSGLPNSLKVPDFQAHSAGSVDFHHNHPKGDSLSAADFNNLLSTSAIGSVNVHGHNGFFAQASRVGSSVTSKEALIIADSARSKSRAMTSEAVDIGTVTADQADAGLWQVVMALLLENDGVIRYTANSEYVMSMAKRVIHHGR